MSGGFSKRLTQGEETNKTSAGATSERPGPPIHSSRPWAPQRPMHERVLSKERLFEARPSKEQRF